MSIQVSGSTQNNPQRNLFTAYGEDYVQVGEKRFSTNVIVLSDRIITDWTPHRFAELNLSDMEMLAALDVEIILLGTGQQWRFPPAELMQPFMHTRKGVEFMSIPAACCTSHLLMSEGRKVAAALLFE